LKLTEVEKGYYRIKICKALKDSKSIKSIKELLKIIGLNPEITVENNRGYALINSMKRDFLEKIYFPKLEAEKEKIKSNPKKIDYDTLLDLIEESYKDSIKVGVAENRVPIFKDKSEQKLIIAETVYEYIGFESALLYADLKRALNRLSRLSICEATFSLTHKKATDLLSISKLFFREYLNGDFKLLEGV